MRSVGWDDHISPRRAVNRSMGARGWISDDYYGRDVVRLVSD